MAGEGVAGQQCGRAGRIVDPGGGFTPGRGQSPGPGRSRTAGAGGRRGEKIAQATAIGHPVGRRVECDSPVVAVRLVLRLVESDPALSTDRGRSRPGSGGHAQGGAIPGAENCPGQGPVDPGLDSRPTPESPEQGQPQSGAVARSAVGAMGSFTYPTLRRWA